MFAIDAAGAFVSILLLALVLPTLENFIGMPYRVLYLLAMIAAILFLLSTFFFLTATKRWRPLLLIAALGNLFYCLVTAAAIYWFRGDLTVLGKVYFVAESLVILTLALFEMAYIVRSNRPNTINS